MITTDHPDFSSTGIAARNGSVRGVAEDIFGAAVVFLFLAVGGFVRWVIDSGSWIIFFLVSKPLFDLTWQWEFFNIFNQRVNPQSIVAVLVTLLNLLVGFFSFRNKPYSGRVFLFLGMATVSVVVTPTAEGLNELIRLYSGVSFFFTAGLALAHKKKFDEFSSWLLVVLCLPLALSCLQVAGVLPFNYWDWIDGHEVGRASGTYQHPLEIVNLLVYAIPLALFRWEKSRRGGGERIFLGTFFVLALVGLGSTLHRVGWVAISVELIVWYFWNKRLKRIALAALAVAALAIAFSDQMALVYDPTDIVPDRANLESGHFLRGRGANWIAFLASYAKGGPVGWIVGRGGSVPDIGPEAVIELSEDEPHNDFIRILHAYGLVGLFLYLSIIAAFLRQAFHSRESQNPHYRSIGIIVACAVIGTLFLSMTTEPTRYPTAVWYLFALGSALFWKREELTVQQSGRVLPEHRTFLYET